MEKKHPLIGGIGCLGVVVGLILVTASAQLPGGILFVAGLAVLVYALVTGNVKLFG